LIARAGYLVSSGDAISVSHSVSFMVMAELASRLGVEASVFIGLFAAVED
jgi:hypothetical protein